MAQNAMTSFKQELNQMAFNIKGLLISSFQ